MNIASTSKKEKKVKKDKKSKKSKRPRFEAESDETLTVSLNDEVSDQIVQEDHLIIKKEKKKSKKNKKDKAEIVQKVIIEEYEPLQQDDITEKVNVIKKSKKNKKSEKKKSKELVQEKYEPEQVEEVVVEEVLVKSKLEKRNGKKKDKLKSSHKTHEVKQVVVQEVVEEEEEEEEEEKEVIEEVDEAVEEESEEDSDDDDDDEEDSEEERIAEEKSLERLRLKELERKRKSLEAAEAAAKWVESLNAKKHTPVTQDSVDLPKKKKRKLSNSNTNDSANNVEGGAGGGRVSGEAFRRVDVEEWSKQIVEGLEDNSYEQAFGVDGYGAKASAVLMQVRGKDFRHEKTKKKRGSYRGGSITLASNSFKYSDD